MIFFPFSIVFVLPPEPYVTYAGGSAEFDCLSVSTMTIRSIVWFINGSLLEDLTLGNVRQALLRVDGNTAIQGGSLRFADIPVEHNTTIIQCLVESSTGNVTRSPNTSLLVQG